MFDEALLFFLLVDVFQQVMREFQLPDQNNTVDELGYEEALKWLMRHQPQRTVAVAALLRQQQEDGGCTIRAFYFDDDTQPICQTDGNPFSYVIHARSLDSELNEAFGTENIVLVK